MKQENPGPPLQGLQHIPTFTETLDSAINTPLAAPPC